MPRILAVDFGLKRSGIAITDPLQIIASPLETVATGELMDFLENYLRKENVECLVIGDPKNLDNTPNEISEPVNRFIGLLKERFPALPVHKVDERFTSKMAQQAILLSGKNKKARRDKSLLDKVSAALILQSYLDSKK